MHCWSTSCFIVDKNEHFKQETEHDLLNDDVWFVISIKGLDDKVEIEKR